MNGGIGDAMVECVSFGAGEQYFIGAEVDTCRLRLTGLQATRVMIELADLYGYAFDACTEIYDAKDAPVTVEHALVELGSVRVYVWTGGGVGNALGDRAWVYEEAEAAQILFELAELLGWDLGVEDASGLELNLDLDHYADGTKVEPVGEGDDDEEGDGEGAEGEGENDEDARADREALLTADAKLAGAGSDQ